MAVTRIHFITGRPRPVQRTGDRRTTKKHGLQIRIPAYVHDSLGRRVGYDCTGGRQRYEWVSVDKLPADYLYLLTPEERSTLWATP